MTDPNQKQQDQKKGGLNPVVAAVAGAVVGAAAVGVAGAAVLANDDSRKKVEKVIDKTKDNISDMKTGVEEKITEVHEKVNKIADVIKDTK